MSFVNHVDDAVLVGNNATFGNGVNAFCCETLELKFNSVLNENLEY